MAERENDIFHATSSTLLMRFGNVAHISTNVTHKKRFFSQGCRRHSVDVLLVWNHWNRMLLWTRTKGLLCVSFLLSNNSLSSNIFSHGSSGTDGSEREE